MHRTSARSISGLCGVGAREGRPHVDVSALTALLYDGALRVLSECPGCCGVRVCAGDETDARVEGVRSFDCRVDRGAATRMLAQALKRRQGREEVLRVRRYHRRGVCAERSCAAEASAWRPCELTVPASPGAPVTRVAAGGRSFLLLPLYGATGAPFDCGDDLHAVEEVWRCALEFGPRVRVRVEVPAGSAASAADRGDGDRHHAGRLFSFYADVRRDHCRSDAVAALAAFDGMQ
jgi:hypothetical protein